MRGSNARNFMDPTIESFKRDLDNLRLEESILQIIMVMNGYKSHIFGQSHTGGAPGGSGINKK